ncbi:hypothetical protein [Microcoleus sp. bin48.metabat.b7b8b9.023]|nr:hypothetical protein [Microcoleus sp. bin48.metabat.b7b8b9.023]
MKTGVTIVPLPTTDQQWDLESGDGWLFDDNYSRGGVSLLVLLKKPHQK